MSDKETPTGLMGKLAEILADVERVPKRGVNQHYGYKYVLDADVIDSARNAFAEHGIVFLPAITEHAKDGHNTYVYMDMTLIDGESGEKITLPWVGEAYDQQDKGTAKAVVGAIKYFLIKLLLMPTGEEDADAHAGAPDKQRPQRKQPVRKAPAQQGKQKPPASNPGLYVLTFGKHKGKTIAQVAADEEGRDYLQWIIDNAAENHPEDVAAAKAYLQGDQDAPMDGGEEDELANLRTELVNTAIAAGFASGPSLDTYLQNRGKPAIADMTKEQLEAAIAWAQKGTQ